MTSENLVDIGDGSPIDISDLVRKYSVKMDMGLENFVIVDGIPVAPESKVPLLSKVLTKFFSTAGTIKKDGLYIPTGEGKTLGFAFVEYSTTDEANNAVKEFDGKRFDAKHTFIVNKLADIERYGSDSTIGDSYQQPEKTPFKPREHLRSWLCDPACRDQFFLHVGSKIEVNWFKGPANTQVAGEVKRVESPSKWSPKGTYLATQHVFGVQLNGGESFGIVGQFLHHNVQLFDFSPNEKYLVTFSDIPIGESSENEPDNPKNLFGEKDRGNQVVIWDTRTQLPLRSFRIPPSANGQAAKIVWPIFKWSSNSKYFARVTKDTLSIYSTPSMSLVGKKSVSIPGIVDFSFAPTTIALKNRNRIQGIETPPEELLCYWTPEMGEKAARVSLMTVPTKEVIRTRNLFNVIDCRFHWQDDGKYLCVKVDRHTKNKKNTFTILEFFRLTERDIPVESIELKETVINFAWEPKGSKFILVSRQDSGSQPVPSGNNSLSFYGLEKKKLAVQSSWKLLKKLDKKTTNSIYWCPAGRFAATSNFGPTSSTPTIEYWDTEYDTDKKEGSENVTGVHLIGSFESYGLVDLQWDPSGRYTAVWTNKGQGDFKILNFHGQLLQEKLTDNLRFLSWRPRPPSPLTEEERAKIISKLDKYSSRFDEEDAMEADIALRELITKRRNQFSQWLEFRKAMTEKLHALSIVTEEERLIEESGTVEEIIEEIIEETEEIVN